MLTEPEKFGNDEPGLILNVFELSRVFASKRAFTFIRTHTEEYSFGIFPLAVKLHVGSPFSSAERAQYSSIQAEPL